MSITNPNKPTGSAIFNFLPGTVSAPGIGFMNIGGVSGAFFQVSHNLATRFITKSFEDRLYIAEFDDGLVEQAWWANPRYKGCKATGKAINKYSPAVVGSGIGFFQIANSSGTVSSSLSSNGPAWQIGMNRINFTKEVGDITYGLNPVVQNETTALFIATTVVGGEEDAQFATLENHSYIGISKILIVNIETDTVDIVDRTTEGWSEFHRFITNDLPTGGAFSMKILDESISSKLKQKYHCKMNKGWLLKSFDFVHAGEFSGSREATGEDHLQTNNSMYFYRDGLEEADTHINGMLNESSVEIAQSPISGARFRYAVIDMFADSSVEHPTEGDLFTLGHMGPSFVSSSIISNKYTRQFYSGGFGLIDNDFNIGSTNAERISNSDLGRASRFIGINMLDHLKANVNDTTIPEEDKTEIHVTFLHGVKDFSISVSGSGSPGNYSYNESANDERSIGTFEVDQNQTSLDIGDHCHSFLPQTHEIIFKSAGDGRFMPTIDTFEDEFDTAYLQYTGSPAITLEESLQFASEDRAFEGCTAVGEQSNGTYLQRGVNISHIEDGRVFIQGGALGPVGHRQSITSSNPNYRKSISGSMTADNYYGGYLNAQGTASLDYQISFLDKDHTIIANINKDEELFDGIGTKGIVIIPDHTHPKVKRNLELYLQRGGMIDVAPGGLTRTIIE